MLYCLEPRYQVLHRKTFMERVIPDLYKKVKASIISSITSADCYAIITDCWTSYANEAYIGVTFHTITTDWDLQHFVLENEELSEQHTACVYNVRAFTQLAFTGASSQRRYTVVLSARR